MASNMVEHIKGNDIATRTVSVTCQPSNYRESLAIDIAVFSRDMIILYQWWNTTSEKPKGYQYELKFDSLGHHTLDPQGEIEVYFEKITLLSIDVSMII